MQNFFLHAVLRYNKKHANVGFANIFRLFGRNGNLHKAKRK